MNKVLTLFLSLPMLLCLVLCGCDQAKPVQSSFVEPQYEWNKSKGQKLTLWGNREDISRSNIRKALARYERLTGNTLEVKPFSHQDLEQQLTAAFLAGTIAAPDIVLSFGGAKIEYLRPHQNFYDFTSAVWVNDLTDTSLDYSIFRGKVIGLPYGEKAISGILYNKGIFSRMGLQVPRTQQEFMQVCRLLFESGITPVYLPYADSPMLLYQLPLDSLVMDEMILESINLGNLNYADLSQMRDIVSWYRNMSDLGYFGKNYTDNNWAGMNNAMRSGQYAMLICWDTWLYTEFTGNPATFGIMPAFMGSPDEGVVGGPNQVLFMVNKKSNSLDASLEFITFLADPYNYNDTFSGIYSAPTFRNQTGFVTSPQYMAAERLIEKRYFPSTALLRIRGFSQLDASYIQRHMQDRTYSVEQCLKDMDNARLRRITAKH